MTRRGKITFQSVECEYNELYEAYDIDGDIKNDVQVLTDYCTYSGYYMVLNDSFWKSLIHFIFQENSSKLSKKEFNSRPASLNVSFSNFEELRNLINNFSTYITNKIILTSILCLI